MRWLVVFIQEIVCARDLTCYAQVNTLLEADVVDMDFDINSNKFTMSGFWARAPGKGLRKGWLESIYKPVSKTDKVELAVLGTQKAIDADEIQVGGRMANVGVDEEMSTLDPKAASCLAVIGVSQLTGYRTYDVLIPFTASRSPPVRQLHGLIRKANWSASDNVHIYPSLFIGSTPSTR